MRRFIYEMDEGKPVYYKSTEGFLEKTEQPLLSIVDTNFQAWLKMEIAFLSRQFFKNNQYLILTNSHRFLGEENLLFISDVEIIEKESFYLNAQPSKKRPKFIVKIDSKEDNNNLLDRRKKRSIKINQLLHLGVEKIIWIHSDAQIIKVITPKKREIVDWHKDILILNDFSINIQKILDNYYSSTHPKE